jgi:YD repeat-containing protein
VGIDQNLESSQVYGKRLTLFYNASNRPELRLDGTVLATGNVVTPGTYYAITLSVDHPYAANGGTYCDQSFPTQIKAGGSYLIVNGWAGTGRRIIEKHRKALRENQAAGGADSSEPVLGETLSMIAMTWLAETTRGWSLTDGVADTSTTVHHTVGFCGQTDSPYIDMPMCTVSVTSGSGDAAAEDASFFVQSGVASAMEWGVIEQMQPFSAVSTVKLIDMANSRSDKLYDAKTANYSTIKPLLRNYSTNEFTQIEGYINAGWRVVLPEDADLTEGSWTGLGFLAVSADEKQIGHIISGGLKGGFGTTPGTADPVTASTSEVEDFDIDISAFSQEPIDLVHGDYFYAHDDLSIGSGAYPFTLGFSRHYNSRDRLTDGALGLGWTHTFDVTASVDSDAFQGMAEDSPIDAAAAIAEIYVATDILRGTKTNTRLVAASLGHRWVMDRLIGNVVTIKEPQRSRSFVALPDGTYNPPPGSADVLTHEPDDTYHVRAKDGIVLDFDASGKLSQWSDPNGNTVSLTYNSGKLQSVSNGCGRSLSFTYTGDRLDHVTDSAARTVYYEYDAAGNLTTATDCAGVTKQRWLPGPNARAESWATTARSGQPSLWPATNQWRQGMRRRGGALRRIWRGGRRVESAATKYHRLWGRGSGPTSRSPGLRRRLSRRHVSRRFHAQ